MIKTLRKRHLQIWALWAILIPVGIIVAWMAVPRKVTQELLQEETLRTTYDTIASVEKANYTVNILLDLDLHLEFINKRGLRTPSMLLYQIIDSSTDNIDKQELIGRIQKKGSQFFPLKMQWKLFGDSEYYYNGKFILYDIVKKQVIDSVIFKTPLQGMGAKQ